MPRSACLAAFVLACCAAFVLPPPSAAQDVPLAPLARGSRVALLPGTQQALGLPPAAREEAVHAVTVALRKRGFDVLPASEVDAVLSERMPDGCRDAVTCDPELALRILSADAVISLVVWGRSEGAREVLVHVRRKQSFGQAELSVQSDGLGRAATDALEQALADALRRHDVPVRIESEPSGARIVVNQAEIGVTPATLQLPPGQHLLSVGTPGFVTVTRYIEVPAEPAAPLAHHIELVRTAKVEAAAPSAADGGAALHGASRNTTANYLVAALLGAVAVPLLANAIYTGASSGSCDGRVDAQGHCAERVTLGPSFWTSLALGSLAAVGGGLVLIVQPFAHATERAPRTAHLQWQTQF